jgi:hypothetical protein
MKNWPPNFFSLVDFPRDTNFFQSKVGKTENVVISERAYSTRAYVTDRKLLKDTGKSTGELLWYSNPEIG